MAKWDDRPRTRDRQIGKPEAANNHDPTGLVVAATSAGDSLLSHWFQERVAGKGRRIRKIMITALARKLLVALWKYVTAGVVIERAVMKTA